MSKIQDFHDKLIRVEPIDLFNYVDVIPELLTLQGCDQNPNHHFEGNVLTHTNMALAKAYEFCCQLNTDPRSIVKRQNIYLGTLMHDLGKPDATFMKGDKLVAYNHETIGVPYAREFLRKYFPEFGFGRREWIISLVEYHMRAREIAKEAKLAPLRRFSLDVDTSEMYWVAMADSLGRTVPPGGDLKMEWSPLYLKRMQEEGIYGKQYEIPDNADLNQFEYKNLLWKVLFGNRSDSDPKVRQDVHNLMKKPFQIIITAGAPGSGKTTYRKTLYPDIQTICMDDERERLCGTAHDQTRNQEVFDNCYGRLRKALLAKENVIWDSTSADRKMRRRIIDLARCQGALIEFVYFDIPLEILQARNAARDRVTPPRVVESFYRRLAAPKPYEYDVLRVVDERTPHPGTQNRNAE
jgi:putative nucleotidyltransferase with HDIG domain